MAEPTESTQPPTPTRQAAKPPAQQLPQLTPAGPGANQPRPMSSPLPTPARVSANHRVAVTVGRIRQQYGGRDPNQEEFNRAQSVRRGFWENPQRVAAYYNLLRSRPPDYQLPPGIDRKQLEIAYQYLKFRNGDKPWTEWQYLSDTDPGSSWLRSLAAPPTAFVMPKDQAALTDYQPGQMPTTLKKWDELPGWVQAYLSLNAPQSPGIEGRPDISRLSASSLQGVMGGIGIMGLGTLIGGPWLGAALGLAVLGGTVYTNMTGQEIPGFSQSMALFNKGAEAVENAWGVLRYAKDYGWDEVWENFPAAWRGAAVNYNTMDDLMINNIWAPILGRATGGSWNGEKAEHGEAWDLTGGEINPVQVEGPLGTAAIDEAIQRIQAGEDYRMVTAEISDRFHDSGLQNEAGIQMIADPTNLAPFIGGKAGAKIADLTGHTRLAEHIRTGIGNPVVDMLPLGLQQLVQAIGTRYNLKALQGSTGLLGSLQSYKTAVVLPGYWKGGTEIPEASKLPDFDKRLAGLNEKGQVKEFLPAEPKKGLAGVAQMLTSLTPVSKVHAMISIFHDNIAHLLDGARESPLEMNQLVEKDAGVRAVDVGEAAEGIIKSPLTATIQDGLRDYVASGTHEKLLAEWDATADQRRVLGQIATLMHEDNLGNIVERIKNNPETFARELAQTAGIPDAIKALATPENLKAFFKPYLDDNPAAWHVNDYRTRLMATMSDHMDAYLAKTYDIKPDHPVFRLSQVMKGVQSLLLLGSNPTYFINNAVNNAVTRAAVGVFGYLTPKQIDSYMERFGLVPHRLREGLGQDINSTEFPKQIEAARHPGDWIDGVQKVVDATNKKLGLFSKWSGRNEQFESSQAYTIGMLRFMGKHWKKNKGMRAMTPVLETILDRQAPGMKEIIYAAAEAGLNMREIEAKLLGDFVQPQVSKIVSDAAAKAFPNNPDIAEAIIRETGIVDALDKKLANARNADDVDSAINSVEKEIGRFVDEAAQRDLVHRAEEVKNQVKNEGFHAVLDAFNDLQVKLATRWLRHFADWQEVMNKKDTMTAEAFDTSVRHQMEQDGETWARINAMEEQTMAGMMQAIGLDTPAGREFNTLLVQAHENWKRFYQGWDDADGHHPGRNEKLKNYFASNKRKKGETYEAYQARTNTAWKRLQAELDADYRRTAAEENRIQEQMNQRFAQSFEQLTGRPAAEAMSWREQVQVIRMQMQEEMRNFRQSLENGTLTAEDRRAAWSSFIQRYSGLVAQLKNAEIDGAYNLAHQPRPAGGGEEIAAAQAAVAQAGQPPATPGEAEINASMAAAAAAATISPEAAALLKMAADAGIKEKDGSPLQPNHLVNIVNESLRTPENPNPRQYKPDELAQIPEADVQQAIRFNKIKHGHEHAQTAAELAMQVDDILAHAEAGRREAELRAAGLMSRRQLREKWKAFGVNEDAIAAAMRVIELHAQRWAKQNRLPIDDLTMDRWIATHIQDILDQTKPGGLQDAAPEWYYSGLQRTLDSMPTRMTPEALEGFLKGKTKAEEIKWTGFDEWLAEKKAKGEQVTRQEAVNFVRSHRIRVKEVTLGGEGGLADMPGYAAAADQLRQAGWRIEENPDEPDMVAFSNAAEEDWDFRTSDELPTELQLPAQQIEEAHRAYARGIPWAADEEFKSMVENLQDYGVSVETRMTFNDWFEDTETTARMAFEYMRDPTTGEGEGDLWTDEEVRGADRSYMMSKIPKPARVIIQNMVDFADNYKITTGDRPAKFFQYTDRQGQNYKELLLEWDRPQDELMAWDYYENHLRQQIAKDTQADIEHIRHWEDLSPSDQADIIADLRVKRNLPNFVYSPHWDEEVNVLAHVRFSERTNKAGERILYIEEIQSDLHEQGREKGYQLDQASIQKIKDQIAQLESEQTRLGDENLKEMQSMVDEAMEHMAATGQQMLPIMALQAYRKTNPEMQARFDAFLEKGKQLRDLQAQIDELKPKLVPNADKPPMAPFKNSWPELVVKRMIRYASENGFDRVAIASGKENADRYSLSNYYNQVDIQHTPDHPEGVYLYTYDKGTGRRESHGLIMKEKLHEYVGQEIATKALAPQEQLDATVTFKGKDLAVGGHGMRRFYDEMIPSMVDKYIKKWGSKIEPTDYGKEPPQLEVREMSGRHGKTVYAVWDGRTQDYVESFDTRQEAQDLADQMQIRYGQNLYEQVDEMGRPGFWNVKESEITDFEAEEGYSWVPQDERLRELQRPSFKVTPEMKKAAMEGQALFDRSPMLKQLESTPEVKPRAMAPTSTQEFKDFFRKSQILEMDDVTPMVVYHATTAEFDTFRLSPEGEIGIHFGTADQATDRVTAKFSPKGQPPRYIAAYIRIENPLMLDQDWGGWDASTFAKAFKKRGDYFNAGRIEEAMSRADQWRTAELEKYSDDQVAERRAVRYDSYKMEQTAVTAILEDLGYDGYAYPNQVEGKPGDWSFAVLRPDQIKSIYNSGEYKRTNNMYRDAIPIAEQVKRIQDMSWGDPATLAGIFQNGTPKQLQGIINFIVGQRKKYNEGRMTARDVAKAYLLTVSSIGSKEKPFEGVLNRFQEKGIHFVRDGYPMDLDYYAYRNANGQWMIRPEEVTAAWLMTDEGRSALDAIERGEITPAWQHFLDARIAAFGRFGGGPESATGGWFTKPHSTLKTLADIRDVTKMINDARGDTAAISRIEQQLYGIGVGKSGFMKHLLGFGDETTIDAQEINFWTGQAASQEDADFIRQRWHNTSVEVQDAIKQKIQTAFYQLRKAGVGADIPEEAFVHIMHHWAWDAMKQTETTHQGMYRAMQYADAAGGRARASVNFIEDGRAVIRAQNAPTVGSMMHEIGHIFRRDLNETDLGYVAQLGGLKDASELRTLEARFLSGELREGDPDYQRYVDAEERFARSWERYLIEGDAPTPELRSIFHRFTKWLLDVYRSLKQEAGKITGWNQQPEFAEYGGAEVTPKLREIFDRMLVSEDQIDRPMSFDELVANRIKFFKDTGRHYAHYTMGELKNLSTSWVIKQLLGDATDMQTARARAEAMWDEEIVATPSRDRWDQAAAWDALREIEKNPKLAPWYVDPAARPADASGQGNLSLKERQALNRPVRTLPTPVQHAIQEEAKRMLGELQHGGRETNVNWDTNEKFKGTISANWWLELNKSQGGKVNKQSFRSALEKIIAGTEDNAKPTVQLARSEILYRLIGETPTDSGPIYDAAVLWYLDRKDILFQKFADQFETATQDWLEQHFGTDADKAMNEYLLAQDTDIIPEEMPSLVERAAGEQQAIRDTFGQWEQGDTVPLDQVIDGELVSAGKLPTPDYVNAEIAIIKEGMKPKEAAYADELIDWYSDPHHMDTIPATSLPPAKANKVEKIVHEHRQPLERWAREQEQPITLKPNEIQPGLVINRTYDYTHGTIPVVGIVYLDGFPVAYLPTGEAARPFIDDGTRLLGLDPEDPDTWVIYRDGKLGKINPENPGRPFMPEPEPEPQPRIDNQVFAKRTSEMTPREAEYALTHDEMTGLKNRRAYEESPRKPVQVVLDVEGLKFINDNYGHEAGDQVIKALANSLLQVAPDESYRGSSRGDEFLMQFETEEQALAAVDRASGILATQRITTGDNSIYEGLGVSAGIGRTLQDADMALNKNKAVAISEGRRANRGEKPVNLREVAPSAEGELPGIPPAEFNLQQQTAEAETYKPPAAPQESLFNRQEYNRTIQAKKAEDQGSDDPNRLFDEQPTLFQESTWWESPYSRLTPPARRALVKEWTARMEEFTTESQTITGSGWVTEDGRILIFEREPSKGYFITHYDTTQDATGDTADFEEFVRTTRWQRVDRHRNHIMVEAFTKLNQAQIDAIMRSVSEDVDFSVDISEPTPQGSTPVDFFEDIFGYEKAKLEEVLHNAHRNVLQDQTPEQLPDHPWIRKLKERYQTTPDMRIPNSYYLTRAGEFVMLDADHDTGAKVGSGINIRSEEFQRKTRAVRIASVDTGDPKPTVYAVIMSRPNDAQMDAIYRAVGDNYITIMVGEHDEWTSAFDAKDHKGIAEFLDQAFEHRSLYDIDPGLTFSAVADFPSPMSGYVGNKRSMLQAGHYNEILTRSRGQSYNKILEAFGGSGLLGNAFQTRTGTPRLLNELDDGVINMHRQVKENTQDVLAAIRAERDRVLAIMHANPNGGGEAYGQIQDYWKDMPYRLGNGTPAEKAAMTIIQNSGSLAVMGGGQKLISGASVSEGSYVWRIADDSFDAVIDQVEKHGKLLQNVELTQADAREILAGATPHELVLLDPPYVQRSAEDARATGYQEGADLTTLQGGLDFIHKDMREAAERGVPMVYTNNAHPAIVAALEDIGFHVRLVEVRSQNRGGQAVNRMEVVAWNDPVGPADRSFRAAETTARRQAIGSGRMEWLQYKARARASQPQPEGVQAIGDVPLGGTPTAEPVGQTLDEVMAEHLGPMLGQIRDDYKAATRQRKLKFEGLDQEAQDGVRTWLRQIQGDLATTKYAAMSYGQAQRDAALLNYNRRYGFDSFLGTILPYQFWYTRSMVNWSQRMIDRPAWFAMYYRIRHAQEEAEKKGMPSRLRGKIRMPAPWLPDWAGGGIWTDPLQKLFPFAQFGQPMERWTQDQAQIERRAESIVDEMLQAELITSADATAAKQHQGAAWDRAMKQAGAELDKDSNPASIVTQMVQPPLWWNIASNLAKGTPEKISPLPGTRLAQSIRTATRGTFAEGIGDVAGWAAWPEEKLRGVAGLSKYGQWGEYYIDRQLANMAADGTITPEAARMAMIQRSGDAFTEAVRRTEYELMLRTPGAPTLAQLLKGDIKGAAQSLPTVLFPGGLFPTGELKFRNIQSEYNAAWSAYREGDTKALQTFFDHYPEYEARLALFAEPEERLQQFLVNEIWDKYTKLSAPNRSRMTDTLGPRFEDLFLNKETRSYETIPVEELALWARIMNGNIPKTPKTQGVQQLDDYGLIPQADLYDDPTSQAIEAYRQQRDQQFPGIFAMQEAYFNTPKKNRRQVLTRFPQLRQYWDWKKGYEQQHPELAGYFEESRQKAAAVTPSEVQAVQTNQLLMGELYLYGLAGTPLSEGAQQLLLQIKRNAGNDMTLNDYATAILEQMNP